MAHLERQSVAGTYPASSQQFPRSLALAVSLSVTSLVLAVCLFMLQAQASVTAAPAANAQVAPTALTWPTISVVLVTNNVTQPVYVGHAGDSSGRLFIVERAGIIRIYQNGSLLSTPFLNITSRVESGSSEQGLLSVAFPPGYSSKQHFYVYYTAKTSGDLVLARYGLTGDPNVADAASETILLTIPHPTNKNHNGGQLQFSPRDGYLYMATGDGGGGGDIPNNAQNTNVLLGKVLRLDVETGNPTTYTIPSANPFTQTAGFRPEIWALGLRNPWRFSFDRQAHDLYLGDVGQGSREEIDFQAAASAGGQNYGWRCYEGNLPFNTAGCGPMGNYTFPIWDYSSLNPVPECAVTGGYVFRGPLFNSMRGIYFYGDYCSGTIWGLQYDGAQWQNQMLLPTNLNISSFGEDEAGNLYIANLNNAVYIILGADPAPFSLFLPLLRR